jgi:beta-lactamase regulating signal transducer with metallopeptidase domain
MPIADHCQALAQIFAGRMLNSTAEGIVIAGFIWILLRTMRRQNSSTRFAMWLSALAAVAVLPLAESMRSSALGATTRVSRSAFQLPGLWAVYLLVVWAIVAAIGLAKIGISFWQLRKLRQSCKPIDSSGLNPVLRDTLTKLGSGRRVILSTSDRVRVPTAIGFSKPAILLPVWALGELSPPELNAILLHELAHLQRRDDWTNLAQRILTALLFFHPAVWLIGEGLSREREMACDDFVLAATSNPRGYAQCLVTVAEKSFLRRSLSLAQAAVGRMQQTALRVARILDADRPTATRVWKPALGLVSAVSVACLISMPHAPRLVAFDEAVSPVSESAATLASASAVDSAWAEARMIPAALHRPVPKASVERKAAIARGVNRQARNDHELSAVAAHAKFQQPQTNVINAGANDSGDHAGRPSSVLLVMHTEQVDEYGQVWDVCVWRLTVFHPVDREVHKAITPKST